MRIKQLLVCGLFLIGLGIKLAAQEGLPFYQQYLIGDKYLINASYAGQNPEILTLRFTNHSQWSGLEDAPRTQTLSSHATIIDRLALGFYAFSDRNGASHLGGGNLSAAYHIPMGGENWKTEKENLFSFGLGITGFSQSFDREKWNFQHPEDPLLDNDSYFLVYFNLGASFRYNGAFGGVSVQDIPLGDHRPIVNSIEPLPTWYYLLLGYEFNVTEGIQLEPSLLMNLNSNSERQIDLNFKSKFSMGDNQLMLGISYRTDVDENGSQALTFSPLIGFDVGKFRLGYAYNAGLSDIAREAGGGHLFSLGYDFGNPFNPNWR